MQRGRNQKMLLDTCFICILITIATVFGMIFVHKYFPLDETVKNPIPEVMIYAEEEGYEVKEPAVVSIMNDKVYLIPLENDKGDLSRYCIINKDNYEIQIRGNSLQEVKERYMESQYPNYDPITEKINATMEYMDFKITKTDYVVVDGNTNLHMKTYGGKTLILNIKIYEDLMDIKVGDVITFVGEDSDSDVIKITKVIRVA